MQEIFGRRTMTIKGKRRLSLILAVLVTLVAVPLWAQSGSVRGRILDEAGEPLEDVEILIEYKEGLTRKVITTSNAKGDFVQVGLRSGNYSLTFSKSGYQPAALDIRVQLGEPYQVGEVILQKLPEGVLSPDQVEELSAEIKEYFEKGVAEVEAEDLQAALGSFQKVIELAPDSAEAYFNMGFVYMKLNDPEKALPNYERAVELRPDYYDAHVELGNIYNNARRWDEAMQALEKASEIRPTEINPLYNYGLVAMNAGAMPEAQEAFEKILALAPDHAAANYQVGMVMVNQANNEAAIPYLERYLELEPEGSHAATARGVLDYLKQN
jgi:tetratricopeptide (TPR) repeat protein